MTLTSFIHPHPKMMCHPSKANAKGIAPPFNNRRRKDSYVFSHLKNSMKCGKNQSLSSTVHGIRWAPKPAWSIRYASNLHLPLPLPLPLPFFPLPLFLTLTFASTFTPRICIPLPLPLSLPRQWKKITTVPPTVMVARTPKMRVIYVQLLYPLVLCDTVIAWILCPLPCIYDLFCTFYLHATV